MLSRNGLAHASGDYPQRSGELSYLRYGLEPKTISAEDEETPELIDMSRRFRVSVVLTIPLVIIAMRHYLPGLSVIDSILSPGIMKWPELILATPAVRCAISNRTSSSPLYTMPLGCLLPRVFSILSSEFS
jgi:hypothetical protein